MTRIEFTSSSQKEFLRLPADVQRRFEQAMEALARSWPEVRPRQASRLVGSAAWRLRIGRYRAVFEAESDVLVFTRFEHRSTAYRL